VRGGAVGELAEGAGVANDGEADREALADLAQRAACRVAVARADGETVEVEGAAGLVALVGERGVE
jgi:hypothetical protein